MLNLILETTTGLLKPAGVVPEIPRGPSDITLQLVTNNVAGLLPVGQPLALRLYAPNDTVTPIAEFTVWTRNSAFNLYQARLNPLASDLAWTPRTTLLARISYGTPNADSAFFHVTLGGAGTAAAPTAPVVVPAPAIFTPAFVDIEGVQALAVTASDEDRVFQGTIDGQLKSYQVRPGDDEEDLPGIVRPANFDTDTNAFVLVQL